MTLPNDEAEHLRKLFVQLHNPRVKRHFADVPDDDILSSGPASLKTGCTIQSSDNLLMCIARTFLFEIIVGNSSRMHPAMYAMPVKQYFDSERNFRPQILLFFSQDASSIPDGYSRVEAEITFRLAKETPETMTEIKAIALAKKIKTAFGTIPTYHWTKGKIIFNYQDRDGGYWMRIYANAQSEAKELIEKILGIQGHTFNEEFFKESNIIGKSSINNPSGTRRVYEQQVKKKRWRPTVNVRFRYATLNIDGVNPIPLYDPYLMLRRQALVHP